MEKNGTGLRKLKQNLNQKQVFLKLTIFFLLPKRIAKNVPIIYDFDLKSVICNKFIL